MSLTLLEKFLPLDSLSFLKKWFGDYNLHIHIAKNRNSKLGDYQKLPDHSHKITINHTLSPPLFFFVLTHELAHLIAFDQYKRILPHGKEWKHTFREMLLESLLIYPTDLQPIILDFTRSPKANFMASPDLVMYFYKDTLDENMIFVENLEKGQEFCYRKNNYIAIEKSKKKYLCNNINNGKSYFFRNNAKVELKF